MKRVIHRVIDKMASTIVQLAINEIRQRSFWDVKTINAAIESQREMDRIRLQIAEKTPDCPLLYGYSVFSQCDEDGIVAHILATIKNQISLTETCMEFGTGNGLENNTHFLVLQGFKGFWVDGNPENLEFVRKILGGLKFKNLLARCSRITLDNLAHLLRDAQAFLGSDIDVFSIDVDGNDLYFLRESLNFIRPKVIVAEYNSKFPPPARVTIKYDASHVWQVDDFYGASLTALVEALAEYRLVSCNLSGTNAFFVRNDLADLFPRYRPEELYQPLRLHLAFAKATNFGASLKFLMQSMIKSDGNGN